MLSLHCPATLCRVREWAPSEYPANEKDSSVVSKVSLWDEEEDGGGGGGEDIDANEYIDKEND